jgi:DNA-binding response OmpR family regulator
MTEIIVVDDDVDILQVVEIIFKMHGFGVTALSNPDKLMQKVFEIKPKVVLLDIQLGESDGRLLCREIKELKDNSGVAVILFSATNKYKETLHEFACDAFIEKPFDITQLLNKVEEYI